jgi:hypothetical protein
MLPTVHIGLNGPTDLTITTFDTFTYDNLLFLFGYIIGSFGKINKPVDVVASSTLSVEAIVKHSKKYGKNLLKVLEKIDPKTFGTRKVGNTYRTFSGLVQKYQQRAVPITYEEYEFLKLHKPDSIVNIKNQTHHDQRVYLFCPYAGFPILNYHSFPNQLCIVRCTAKPSNKTQYNICVKELEAETSINIDNRYENQTITLYNPIITKGRRCRLPEELKMVLVDYVLLKLDIEGSIHKYCIDTYGKHPFIIKRDPQQNQYYVLTEYDVSKDYLVIIQSEVNEDHFICLNENTNNPLVFSENEEIKRFFVDRIRKTNHQYNFFNYLEKLLNLTLSENYHMTIVEILDLVSKSRGIKFVVKKDLIYGVMMMGKFYITPQFYWTFTDTSNTIPLIQVVKDISENKVSFPTIDEFNPELVSTLYENFEDGKIYMIKFLNNSVYVKPFDLSSKWQHILKIIFDAKSYFLNMFNTEMMKANISQMQQIKLLNISDVMRNYIYIFMMQNGMVTADELKQDLKELQVLGSVSKINYTDEKYKSFVSWRTSTISEDDFDEYFAKYESISMHDNIKNIYEKFQEDMEFKIQKKEIIIPKIITS